jgi:hypothetical protein
MMVVEARVVVMDPLWASRIVEDVGRAVVGITVRVGMAAGLMERLLWVVGIVQVLGRVEVGMAMKVGMEADLIGRLGAMKIVARII